MLYQFINESFCKKNKKSAKTIKNGRILFKKFDFLKYLLQKPLGSSSIGKKTK